MRSPGPLYCVKNKVSIGEGFFCGYIVSIPRVARKLLYVYKLLCLMMLEIIFSSFIVQRIGVYTRVLSKVM